MPFRRRALLDQLPGLHGRWGGGGRQGGWRDPERLQGRHLPLDRTGKPGASRARFQPRAGRSGGGMRSGMASQPITAAAATPGAKASTASPLASHRAPAISGTTNAALYWIVKMAALMRCTSPAAASLGGSVSTTMKASAAAKPSTNAHP